MCYFVSYIVTESRVYHRPGVDSHEEIIKLAGLRDGIGGGNFVRCEIVPDWTDWAEPVEAELGLTEAALDQISADEH